MIEELRRFLVERLTEDLARLWERGQTVADPRRRPGVAAQVAVIDDLLAVLASDRLPAQRELRILLFGYAGHPDYDSSWGDLLNPATRVR